MPAKAGARSWCFTLCAAVSSGGWCWLWRSKKRERWVKEAEDRIECQRCSEWVWLQTERENRQRGEKYKRIVAYTRERWKGWKATNRAEGERWHKMETNENEKTEKEAALCLDWGGTGTQLSTDTITVIQPALEQSQCLDAQLEALGEMKGRGCVKEHKITLLPRAWKGE